MVIRRHLNIFLISLLFLGVSLFSHADEVLYFYDDNSWLVKVTKGDERILYLYDEVGNLLSIEKETSAPQPLPPVLQGITPDIFIIGSSYNIVITGQNLLTLTSLTTDNPNITIKNITAIDSKVSATLSIASTAPSGQTTITVTTPYGFANMTINLYKLNLSETIALFPLKSYPLPVSLIPSPPTGISIGIANKNPDIVETPSSLTISSGGSGILAIKGLKSGMGTISIGSIGVLIYVFENGTLMNAMPVSVYIEQSSAVDAITATVPVSVYMEQSTTVNAITASQLTSVYIEQPTAVDGAIEVSPLVSVEISSQ